MEEYLVDFGGGEVESVVIGDLDEGGGGLVAIDLGDPLVEGLLRLDLVHFYQLFAVVLRVNLTVGHDNQNISIINKINIYTV